MLSLGWLETRRVSEAMLEAGAISPATARRTLDLPEVVRSDLERYVDAGLVREGAPGTFYLYDVRTAAWTRSRILKAVFFWFLIIIIPFLILQLSSSRTTTPNP